MPDAPGDPQNIYDDPGFFAGYSTLQAHRLAGYYRRIPALLREGVMAPLVRRLPVSHDNMSLDFRAKRFITGGHV